MHVPWCICGLGAFLPAYDFRGKIPFIRWVASAFTWWAISPVPSRFIRCKSAVYLRSMKSLPFSFLFWSIKALDLVMFLRGRALNQYIWGCGFTKKKTHKTNKQIPPNHKLECINASALKEADSNIRSSCFHAGLTNSCKEKRFSTTSNRSINMQYINHREIRNHVSQGLWRSLFTQ